MTINDLQQIFLANKDQDNAKKQEGYLKNQFPFIGLPKPIRSELEREFVKEVAKKDHQAIMEIVTKLHNMPEREYMYTAQQILNKSVKKMTIDDVHTMINLTLVNSWWENTDGYVIVFKKWLRVNDNANQYLSEIINTYYDQENFWLRRFSIICQLGQKDDTDFELMQKAILNNLDDNEFFIQKAIGWALREYSKVNPKDVKKFVNETPLSAFATKEASKFI